MVVKLRTCTICHVEQSVDNFSSKHHRCKPCRRIYDREQKHRMKLENPKHYRSILDTYNTRRQKHRKDDQIFRKCESTIDTHRKRGYIMNMKVSHLMELANRTRDCYYCGNTLKYDHSWDGDNAALDRIDNKKENNISDVRWICYDCNRHKGALTHEQFIIYCDNVVKRCTFTIDV